MQRGPHQQPVLLGAGQLAEAGVGRPLVTHRECHQAVRLGALVLAAPVAPPLRLAVRHDLQRGAGSGVVAALRGVFAVDIRFQI